MTLEEDATPFAGLLHFTLGPYNAECKAAPNTIFWVFGMTWPEIEPWSTRPLVNTLLIRPIAQVYYTLYDRYDK